MDGNKSDAPFIEVFRIISHPNRDHGYQNTETRK